MTIRLKTCICGASVVESDGYLRAPMERVRKGCFNASGHYKGLGLGDFNPHVCRFPEIAEAARISLKTNSGHSPLRQSPEAGKAAS
jgi:hypothetical protein